MKDKEKTYAWTFKNKKVNCYASETSSCKVSKLWEVTTLSAFHDADLARATKQINGILSEVQRGNKDRERELSFIQVQNRHFLAWTSGVVGPGDDDTTIQKTLKLKTR